MSEQIYRLDALTSPDDPRDYIAETIFPEDLSLPEVFDPRNKFLPIRDQRSQGSCVAEASTCVKEVQENKNIGFEDYFSPQFIYNNRENQTTQGMYPRDSMKILYNKGVPAEEDYPYGKVESPDQIQKEVLYKAANYKIKGYAYINTINILKAAIYRSGGAVITFPVYSSVPNFWKPSKVGEVSGGGHAVSVIGWNKEGFILRNSWGENFGDKGYVIYPYSDWGSHGELWTFIDDESSKPDPKYSKWYWKAWRGLINIHKNFKSIYVLEISILILSILSIRGKDMLGFLVSLGIVAFIGFKAIKDRLYLNRDK